MVQLCSLKHKGNVFWWGCCLYLLNPQHLESRNCLAILTSFQVSLIFQPPSLLQRKPRSFPSSSRKLSKQKVTSEQCFGGLIHYFCNVCSWQCWQPWHPCIGNLPGSFRVVCVDITGSLVVEHFLLNCPVWVFHLWLPLNSRKSLLCWSCLETRGDMPANWLLVLWVSCKMWGMFLLGLLQWTRCPFLEGRILKTGCWERQRLIWWKKEALYVTTRVSQPCHSCIAKCELIRMSRFWYLG